MDYQQYRASLVQTYYNYQLETLMSEYDPAASTVILLPGGMGSQLERTENAFPASPNLIDDIVWIDLGILPPKKDALKLEIDGAGQDKDAYVIAPHGPVKFLTENPYGDLRDYARSEGWNYAVFGCDWRRPLKESADFFKTWILDFRQRVRDGFGKDPMPQLSIVCHSMGGLVATTALADPGFSGLGFNAVMTIATPFYGTATQQESYYSGNHTLNALYGAAEVARIIATLPGPYTLMTLPKEIYDRDGPRLGLQRYPEFDHPTPGTDRPCDPYDPALLHRWPKAVRDHWQSVQDCKAEMIGVAAPINANIAPKFINVRSTLDTGTAAELNWKDVDGDTVDPANGPSPIVGLAGPGDGTVPAWSAFHAHCDNRYDLLEASDHPNLLRHEEVLTLIKQVVTKGKLPQRVAAARGKARAKQLARAKLDLALEKSVNRTAGAPIPAELLEKPVQRAMLADLMGGTKPAMAGPSPQAANFLLAREPKRKTGPRKKAKTGTIASKTSKPKKAKSGRKGRKPRNA